MTQQIDTDKYLDFVRQTTSPASTHLAALLSRLTELDTSADADVPRLLTAALYRSWLTPYVALCCFLQLHSSFLLLIT